MRFFEHHREPHPYEEATAALIRASIDAIFALYGEPPTKESDKSVDVIKRLRSLAKKKNKIR